MNEKTSMLVTHVGTFGPYLKIIGQSNKAVAMQLDVKLADLVPQLFMPNITTVQKGIFCLAKRGNRFVRANVEAVSLERIMVNFLDFGHSQQVQLYEIRVGSFPQEILSLPPICTPYILLGVCLDWQPEHVMEVSREIQNRTVEFYLKLEIHHFLFIRMIWKEFDFSEYLIGQKQIGAEISDDQLRDNFILTLQNGTNTRKSNVFAGNNNRIQPERDFNNRRTMKSLKPARPLHGSTMAIQGGSMPFGTYRQSLRSIVQDVHNENTRIPYTGHSQDAEHSKAVAPLRRSVVTFISNSLMVNSVYDVFCCYVENGPCLFCVQLAATETDLVTMMGDLEKVRLKNLTEKPALGMACIARFSEDKQVYRALITSIKPTACHVSYVDYGNAEWVPFSDIYEIPTEFLQHKTFSIKFSLSGYKALGPINEQIKLAFKDMVLYKSLKLKVMPLEGPPLVQYCELNLNGENVLDVLKKIPNSQCAYLKPEPLANDDVVEIRYIDSPKNFFVQKVENIKMFSRASDDLDAFCNKNKIVATNISVGSACAVCISSQWYRAEIIADYDGDEVTVRIVDYGYEAKVKKISLSIIPDRLMRIPQQALRCCLKGFEGFDTVKDLATTQFEMLAEDHNGERKQFNVKVFRVQQNDVYLVSLYRNELDVTKKLYKLSMPFNKYLSLEKEVFNTSHNTIPETPANFLNSTSLIAEENNPAIAITPNQSRDWDQNSSGSTENRDSRSSSAENRGKISNNIRPTPMREINRDVKQSNNNFRGLQNTPENRTVPSSENAPRKYEKTPYQARNVPPRMQNLRVQNDNRRQGNRKFNNSFDGSRGSDQNDTLNSDDLSASENTVEAYVPFEHVFPQTDIDTPSRQEAKICWWISPYQFYTHLQSRTTSFERLMRQLQLFYKGKTPTNKSPKVGSSVIARYRQDSILYRGRVTACNPPIKKYKVKFVDFGNEATVSSEDIWEVEKRFANVPCMGYMCAFNGVVPNYDQNTITNLLEKYVNRDTKVSCEFVARDGDLYSVNVDINGVSLKDSLVNDGVVSLVQPDVRLELLAEQQIRANIYAVRDMLNFQIQLEGCDVKLLCSYEDIKYVKLNPEINKKFKEFYEGKSCVLDVCHVTGDKILIVRPLLPLLKNDIPQYICQYPILHETLNIRVVHVQAAHKLYVHLIAEEHKVTQLLDDMFNYYETRGNNLEKYAVGSICAANSVDGNWYRARIVSIQSEATHQIEVFYIDYGNTETINNETKTKLKRLLHKFCNASSALAIELNLPINSIMNTAANGEVNNQNATVIIDEIKSLTAEYELTAQVLEMRANRIIADISSNGYSIIQVLQDKGMLNGRDLEFIRQVCDAESLNVYEYIETVDLTSDTEESDEERNAAPSQVDDAVIPAPAVATETLSEIASETKDITKLPKTSTSAVLSHIENPAKFFLHLEDQLTALKKFQENLQIVASSLPPLMLVANGAFCIAQNTVDKQWYRTKIIDSELIAVMYIDYGYYDVITDTALFKEMTVMPDMPAFAIPCGLPIKPHGSADWREDVNRYIPYEKPLEFEYITRDEKKNFVHLWENGKSVADSLVTDGHAKHLELIPSGEQCYISHINSLTEFYIQMERSADGLAIVEEALDELHKTSPAMEFEMDRVCGAFYDVDERWYRGKLLAQTSEGYEVFFIDYGNTGMSPKIFEMPEEIASLPPLAKRCALLMPDYILGWSEKAQESFNTIPETSEIIVDLKEPGDPAVIELIIDGQNLIEVLEQLCDHKPTPDVMNISACTNLQISITEGEQCEVFVSHVNGSDDFYVQIATDASKLEDITASLNETSMCSLECPILGTVCAAVFPDDNALYRARILKKIGDEYLVIFIDYGNESMATDLRALPEDLLSIGEFAKHCSLVNATEVKAKPEVEEKFTSIMNTFEEKMAIEVLDKSDNPWSVRVFINGENLCDKLEPEVTSRTKVHIAYVVGPTEFYIQKSDRIEQVEKITKALNEVELVTLDSAEKDTLCVAFYPDDETFYRARVIDVQENGKFEVFFIDFGNSAVVSDLKVLPEDLMQISDLAEKCCLSEIPKAEGDAVNTNFFNLMDSHFGEIFDIENVEDCRVRLYVRDIDIVEELENLVSNKKSPADLSLVDSFKKCTFISVNSPNDFDIQFADDSSVVDRITESLQTADEFEKVDNLAKDLLCAAKFLEDGAFYRAKILSVNSDDECEVLFIDFGNVATSNDIRKLPEDIRAIECVIKHCALENRTDVDFKSDAAVDMFNALINSRFNETFQVEILKTSTDPWVVRLFHKDTNVATELVNELRSQQAESVAICQGIIDGSVETVDIVREITEMDSDTSQQLHTRDLINEIIDSSPLNRSSGVGSLNSSVDQAAAIDSTESLPKFDEEIKSGLWNKFIELKASADAAAPKKASASADTSLVLDDETLAISKSNRAVSAECLT